MSPLHDKPGVEALDLPVRPKGDPDRMAGLSRMGDAIAALGTELSELADHDDRDRYATLARHFISLRREATAMKAWDVAEIALAGERVFSSAVLQQRGLSPSEREFFDNVRHALGRLAVEDGTSELIDMDVIGDALDHLVDDLGVD